MLLLRAVNVAKNQMKMADLRRVLAAAGHGDVRTHLQSGNVIRRSPLGATELESAVERQLAEAFALDAAVMARSPEELAVRGREVYLWCPNGFGRSKVFSGAERILGTAATARNWRTVTTLAELSAANG